MRQLLTLTSLLFLPLATTCHVDAAVRRPNVVYVMADDLGIGDVECYGGERCQIETPGFDRLAREGMQFTDAHVMASHCIPSRLAIMTGRHAWRFAPPRPDGRWAFLRPRIKNDRETLGTMMKRAGYTTGYIGKWHLGTEMQTQDGEVQGSDNTDFTKPLKIAPPDFGFDYSFILPGSLDMFPYVFVRNHKFVGDVTAQKGWSAFNRVGPAEKDFEDYKVLDTFCGEMESFIGQHAAAAKQDRPFFLYFALTAPHTPISPSPKFEGQSKLGLYGDFVHEADDCIARLLAALDKHGIADDTIVMATSDHGACPCAGNIRKATNGQIRLLEEKGHYSAGVHQGYKFSIYEGGLRVPFVVRWPKKIKAGAHCDKLIGTIDVMRTLADVCDVELAEVVAPDSVSFLPLLKDASTSSTRETLVMQSTRAFAVRDGNWKLCICPGSGCPGGHGNTPKANDAWRAAVTVFGRSPRNNDDLLNPAFVQLFNLTADPSESNNLAEKHPHRIAKMFKILEQAITTGRTTPGPRLKNDVPKVNPFAGVPKFVWKR